jgi:hypothetical protein
VVRVRLFHKWFTLKPLVGVRKLPGAGVSMTFKQTPYWRVFCDAEECEVSINQLAFERDWSAQSPTWETIMTPKQQYHFCPSHKGEYHSAFGIAKPSQIIREVKA